MSEVNFRAMLIAVQQGLLFNIVSSIRWIFFKFENNTMILTAAFDKEPTEDERELITDAVFEAAGDFQTRFSIEGHSYYEKKPLEEVNPDGGILVYARNEDLYGQ